MKLWDWIVMCLAGVALAVVQTGIGGFEVLQSFFAKKVKMEKKRSLSVKFADWVVEPVAVKNGSKLQELQEAVHADLMRFFGEGYEKTKNEGEVYGRFQKLEEKKKRSLPHVIVEQNKFWKKWKLKQKVEGEEEKQ